MCPYDGCSEGISTNDFVIRNKVTKKELWINPLTAHLAKKHKLLEKGNKYGISAAEFYTHFMPKSI
jgi:hypothetical protein